MGSLTKVLSHSKENNLNLKEDNSRELISTVQDENSGNL